MKGQGKSGAFDPLRHQLRRLGLGAEPCVASATFGIGGATLRVQANDPGPLRPLAAQLSAYRTGATEVGNGLRGPRCEVCIHVVDYAPDRGPSLPLGPGLGDEQWLAAPAPDQVFASADLWHARWGALLCCWRPFDLLIACVQRGRSLRCDLIAASPFSHREAEGSPPGRQCRLRFKGDPATVWDEVLDSLKGLALCGWGFCCVHAAAVAWGGKAILLVGPSGCGKTTTALALARAGFQVLSDEIAYFRTATGGAPEVWGVSQPPLLQGAVRPDLADLEASLRRGVEQPKQAQPALAAGAGRGDGPPARLAAVLFLATAREPAGHVVVPVQPTEAFTRLTVQVLDALAPLRREQHLTQLAHLLGQVPCHEIRLGPNLAALPTLAHHLLTP